MESLLLLSSGLGSLGWALGLGPCSLAPNGPRAVPWRLTEVPPVPLVHGSPPAPGTAPTPLSPGGWPLCRGSPSVPVRARCPSRGCGHWERCRLLQVFRNPSYSSLTIRNDITLIKLATPAQLNARVSPVCLPQATDDFPGGLTCVTTGWGLTDASGTASPSPSPFPSPPRPMGHGGADASVLARSRHDAGGAAASGPAPAHQRAVQAVLGVPHLRRDGVRRR